MNRFYKILGIVSIIIVIGFSITACGGSDTPQELAKQLYQLDQRVAKLSAEDQKICGDEFKRLLKENDSNKK
ncbi:MAG: hypothetical protein FWH53_02420 [Leptospirales bacterium]|nr:hypothetical protein [Leptospirales bacterium]